MLRWGLRIQEFDVTIQHRAGKLNANADALSRLPKQQELGGKRKRSEMDVEWPDCLPAAPAPPSGVRFVSEPRQVNATTIIDRHIVCTEKGHSFKFSDAAMTMGRYSRQEILAVSDVDDGVRDGDTPNYAQQFAADGLLHDFVDVSQLQQQYCFVEQALNGTLAPTLADSHRAAANKSGWG